MPSPVNRTSSPIPTAGRISGSATSEGVGLRLWFPFEDSPHRRDCWHEERYLVGIREHSLAISRRKRALETSRECLPELARVVIDIATLIIDIARLSCP
jgi:hypothetical protein